MTTEPTLAARLLAICEAHPMLAASGVCVVVVALVVVGLAAYPLFSRN